MNTIISEKHKTYKTYLNRLKESYYIKSLKSSNKIESYTKRLNFFNNKTGEVFPVSYDFMKIQKNNYLWYNFVSTYLQNQAVASNKKAVFITLTTPSSCHPYSTNNKHKVHYPNPNYINNKDAYNMLNTSFRYLTNDFFINRKKVKLKYIKVIEPHKDFTPHLHAIIFLNEDEIDYLKNHLSNVVALKGLGKQFDFTVLESTSASVSYILKYVKKSIDSSNESDSRIIDGWKKDFKIRMFTHSQISVSREVYKVVSRFVDLKSYIIDDGNIVESTSYSILENLESRINLKINYYNNREMFLAYKKKDLFNPFARYSVEIDRYKKYRICHKKYLDVLVEFRKKDDISIFYKELDKLEFDYVSFHNYIYEFTHIGVLEFVKDDYDFKNFFKYFSYSELVEFYENYISDEIFEYEVKYENIGFTIYDNLENKFIYNMMDFSLM